MALPRHPHVLGLDRDAPLALEVHRVEVLLAHVAGVDGAGELEDAVGQRGLAVVDVGDDGEVADAGEVHGRWSTLPAVVRCYRRRLGATGGHRYPSQAVSIEEVRTVQGTRHVANIKSQKKRNLTNAKRAERNKAVKSELKTRVKNATTTIGAEDNDEHVRLAVKRLDKAAAKGVIHKNQAARRKSRLMKKVGAADGLTSGLDGVASAAAGATAGPPAPPSPGRRAGPARPAGRGRRRRAGRTPVASPPPPSRRYWSSAFWPGTGLDAEHARPPRASAVGVGAVEAHHPAVVAVERRPSPAAGGARPARIIRASSAERRRRVAPVDGVGQLPRRHAAGLAEERLDVVRRRAGGAPPYVAASVWQDAVEPADVLAELLGDGVGRRRRSLQAAAPTPRSSNQAWRSRARVGGSVSRAVRAGRLDGVGAAPWAAGRRRRRGRARSSSGSAR